ncbi:hypothetical protein [uncultured Pseudodesulfovibrio sp.]|uniref:hypothetical protein n=1 Tax=uncultured Pseudodesulfovibrio sp. TaxID=2035858 RepID=UPI0029C70A30|nr:hypothetical protein [uncultured Pseudodesulfovibrio sp.]
MSSRPDGCTGIPWITPYEDCCDQHDLAYEQEQSKVAADWVLRRCIRAAGYPVRAWLVWIGLNTVGWPYYWWKGKQ